MASQDINLVIKARDEFSAAFAKFNAVLGGTEGRAGKASKSLVNTFRSAIKPTSQLISAVTRVGFIFSATFGAAGAAVLNVSNKITELDSAASSLGTTADALSRKLYGINVASDMVREGVTEVKSVFNALQTTALGIGSLVAASIGKIGYAAKYWGAQIQSVRTGVKVSEIMKEMDQRGVATEETIKLEVQVNEQIRKLTMSETGYKKEQLRIQLENYKKQNVDRVLIEKLANAQILNDKIDHAKRMNALIATAATLRGDKVGALSATQQNERADAGAKGYTGEEWRQMVQNQEAAMQKLKFDASAIGEIVKGVSEDMTSSLGDAFSDITHGFRNLKDIAADFGQSIINTMSQVAAKFILMKTVGTAFSSFTGGVNIFGSFHQGGVVKKAHSGYMASDEVPIIAQAGEGIISRRGMAALGRDNFNKINSGAGTQGGGVTITVAPVIQAWDASDIYRNRAMITSIISESIKNNSDLRKIMRSYA